MRLRKGELPPITGVTTICKLCGIGKDDALFKWQKGRRQGLVCRECDLSLKRTLYATDAAYRVAAITRARAQSADPARSRQWRARNVDRIQARRKTYHAERRAHINAKSAAWYLSNKNDALTAQRAWYRRDPKYQREIRARYYAEHKAEFAGRGRKWRALNKKRQTAYYQAYRIGKALRVPIWSETQTIRDFYAACPEGYEVDHIVPLFGKLVCGLHVIRNLQYLTASENASKHNRHDPWSFDDTR